MKETTKKTTVKLTVSAMFLALSTVLSMVKIDFPFGGGVTLLSMLPVMLLPIIFGAEWGFFACFVNSIIQMLLSVADVAAWGYSGNTYVAILLLDYILAYSVLGVIGLFRKKGTLGIVLGAELGLFLRLVLHTLTGMFIFNNIADGFFTVLWASVSYNALYMIPEMITTPIVMVIILKNRAFRKLTNT
ncbi:MAG: energy-coupled thiamine transporter ThiT [Clostridia bacterium]|nr:energy-coupled thiamine transporter ThiT [Clostridia bacterium]